MFVPLTNHKLESKFSDELFWLLCYDTIKNEIANNGTVFFSLKMQNHINICTDYMGEISLEIKITFIICRLKIFYNQS